MFHCSLAQKRIYTIVYSGRFALFLLLAIVVSFSVTAQKKSSKPKKKSDPYYGIIYPEKEDRAVCNECIDVINEIPLEVQYGIINESDTLFFVINDYETFRKMFFNKRDGLAVDIVPKSIYDCNRKPVRFTVAKGRLYRPFYMKELLKKAIVDKLGIVYVPLGPFPADLDPKQAEYNILFLEKKNLCHYERFWDINVHKWSLLEMGMYKDAKMESRELTKEITFTKLMKFTIPFEKNKFQYDSVDIQPLYDSLALTKYHIVKMYISAYSSVEGPTENNMRLQNLRAESIVKAFEQFDGDSIDTEITATENWVEFIHDTKDHPKFKSMLNLSKDEIKAKLAEPKTMGEIEPILAKHRKANVVLKLIKKNEYRKMTAPVLTSLFQQKIEENDRAEAKIIQEELFRKIGHAVSPDSLLKGLSLPRSIDFLELTLDQLTYRFNQTNDVSGTMEALYRLDELLPGNARIKYNMTALNLRRWAYGQLADTFNYERLWTEIDKLEEMGIDRRLLARLRINYKIFECEVLMSKRNFAAKNRAIDYIYRTYKDMHHTDADLLNLAKFFTGYGRHDLAIAMLEDKARELDVDEDLIFYYLNLTIIDPKIVAKPFYKPIVLNAINRNKERYCNMFDTYGFGGITFQLLDDRNLRKYYCEECR